MNAPTLTILNISAYKFVAVDDPVVLREQVLACATANLLKGTVLVASEGINLFLAGPAERVRDFIDWLRKDDRFADMQPKESWSASVPFRRLLVKVKREIIRMNNPQVRPEAKRAPSVSAHVLARWLEQGRDDEGRELVMLDTRNAFEVGHGAFDNAVSWNLQKFSDFPDALEKHKASLEGRTVVSYCTGGIRCEKAALLMADAGVVNVLQLEGGILKYLELHGGQPGGRFYKGECFVFDERLSVDAGLRPQASPPSQASASDKARAHVLPSAMRETS